MTQQVEKIHDAQISETSPHCLLKEELRYSGFWVRGSAYIIDNFIVGIAVGFVLIPVRMFASLIFLFLDSLLIGVFFWIVIVLSGLFVRWGYFIFMTHKFQSTLGKMAVGAKVLSDDGRVLVLKQIVIRETIGKIVSNIIFCLGYITIAFTGKKQGFHDKIAHSVVVYKDPQTGPNKAVVGIIYGIQVIIATFFMMFVGLIIAFFGWLFLSIPDASDTVPEDAFEFDEQFLHEMQLNIPESMPVKSL